MATGGPWYPTDGIDPSVDQSSLIKTMLRHTKDKLHLDLSNCRHWNPFLEVFVKRPVNGEKGVARPAENEEKGSEIIVGAQTGGSSDLGAKAKEQTPSKTIVKKRIVKKVAKKKVAEVDKSMDSDSRKKVVEAGKKTPDQQLRSLSYVRVEDMRITIHSLGKFISHREVKELVQSAFAREQHRKR
ncbi:unnamed protein product [Brassica rapa subsp. narinosa]